VAQILTNLLANAVKYCRPGDHVHVSTHRQNGYAILKVADTGPGIAAEHLPHLFERFYRAEASRSRSTGGAGLGLAICKTLTEAHGGEIRVHSVLEKGTTFEVTLPA
jgi:signal transduction histidine kinase